MAHKSRDMDCRNAIVTENIDVDTLSDDGTHLASRVRLLGNKKHKTLFLLTVRRSPLATARRSGVTLDIARLQLAS